MTKRIAGALLSLLLCSTYAEEALDGAAGKLFDVNLKTKTARFLKQDVAYDETGKGHPWHVLRWTDKTTFTSREKRTDFEGIKGPVVATFSGLTPKHAEALKNGKRFMAPQVLLQPEAKEVTGISADGTSVVGWFTSGESENARVGTLTVDGKKIPAVVRAGKRVTVRQSIPVAKVAKGYWKATVFGKSADDVFVVSRVVVERLADRPALDAPKLPRVLSVGDSISINYMRATRAELKGIANYHRIEDNCWSTKRGVAFMAYWLGDYTRDGHGWDVIIFNSGMHDLKQKKLGGPYAVSLAEYKKNLRKEIEIMKPTGAKLMFVTTTPVPNDLGNEHYAFRSKGSEKDFNTAAREVLKAFPEVGIIDLAKVVNESKTMDKWRAGKDVHYWQEPLQAVLGKAVAEGIKKALETRK